MVERFFFITCFFFIFLRSFCFADCVSCGTPPQQCCDDPLCIPGCTVDPLAFINYQCGGGQCPTLGVPEDGLRVLVGPSVGSITSVSGPEGSYCNYMNGSYHNYEVLFMNGPDMGDSGGCRPAMQILGCSALPCKILCTGNPGYRHPAYYPDNFGNITYCYVNNQGLYPGCGCLRWVTTSVIQPSPCVGADCIYDSGGTHGGCYVESCVAGKHWDTTGLCQCTCDMGCGVGQVQADDCSCTSDHRCSAVVGLILYDSEGHLMDEKDGASGLLKIDTLSGLIKVLWADGHTSDPASCSMGQGGYISGLVVQQSYNVTCQADCDGTASDLPLSFICYPYVASELGLGTLPRTGIYQGGERQRGGGLYERHDN